MTDILVRKVAKIRYTVGMKRALALTNKYLSNPAKRAEMIRRSVTSSTAVEGVHIKRYKATLRKHRAKLLKNNILILTV